jgi:hypothetical protein
MPTTSNIHNGSYYSIDTKKQYRPICKQEFSEPDGYIYVYNEDLKPNPAKFLYKQGIVINKNSSNDDGLSLKVIEYICKLATQKSKTKIQIYTTKSNLFEKIVLSNNK